MKNFLFSFIINNYYLNEGVSKVFVFLVPFLLAQEKQNNLLTACYQKIYKKYSIFLNRTMLDLIFFSKIIVSVTAVITLSLIAEHVSPRVAGILSGYPLGAAISLFFYGLEISPDFASKSATYTIMGLIATQFFVYFYFKSSLYFKRLTIPVSSLAAIFGYFLSAWLLHFIKVSIFPAAIITILSIFFFLFLFKEIKNVKIENRIQLTHRVLFFRALLSASIILIVTGTAKLVGSTWAGLFSALPITLFPLILIVHFTYDLKHVHTIIKNFPIGLGSIIVYSITLSFVYPSIGIYLGTLLSFMMATIYLLIYSFVISKKAGA